MPFRTSHCLRGAINSMPWQMPGSCGHTSFQHHRENNMPAVVCSGGDIAGIHSRCPCGCIPDSCNYKNPYSCFFYSPSHRPFSFVSVFGWGWRQLCLWLFTQFFYTLEKIRQSAPNAKASARVFYLSGAFDL